MRVGASIREVLAILDQHGAVSRHEACRFHGGLTQSNVNKYLQRAESMGLATCDRTVHPQRYTSRHDWKSMAGIINRPVPKPRAVPPWGAHNPFGALHG